MCKICLKCLQPACCCWKITYIENLAWHLREGRLFDYWLVFLNNFFHPQKLTLFPLPPGHPDLTLFLVLLGKFGVLVCTGILYMFTGELSPTVIRNTVMSSCAMLSRAGSSISPYLLQLGEIFGFRLSLREVLVC